MPSFPWGATQCNGKEMRPDLFRCKLACVQVESWYHRENRIRSLCFMGHCVGVHRMCQEEVPGSAGPDQTAARANSVSPPLGAIGTFRQYSDWLQASTWAGCCCRTRC